VSRIAAPVRAYDHARHRRPSDALAENRDDSVGTTMPSRAAILAIAFVGLAGTIAAQGPPSPPPAGTASVRGRIVAADTGKPLRRASVSLSSLDSGGRPRTANTNADGRYEFKELPAGRYSLSAARSGYLQLRYGQRRPLEAVRPLQIFDGQVLERV